MENLITRKIIGAARDIELESAFRLDFLVEQQVVVEIKSVEAISNIHVSLK